MIRRGHVEGRVGGPPFLLVDAPAPVSPQVLLQDNDGANRGVPVAEHLRVPFENVLGRCQEPASCRVDGIRDSGVSEHRLEDGTRLVDVDPRVAGVVEDQGTRPFLELFELPRCAVDLLADAWERKIGTPAFGVRFVWSWRKFLDLKEKFLAAERDAVVRMLRQSVDIGLVFERESLLGEVAREERF